MVGAFGWTNLSLAPDPPSASRFPTGDPNDQAATSEAAGGHVPTILLVEDNKSDVFIIREILKQEGLNAILQVASDGEQALSMLDRMDDQTNSGCPDLVLLDLNLPRVSGLEVLARMRRTNRCAATPVVVVTSSQSPGDLAAIRALNASAYFQKQADLTAFLQLGKVIKRVLAEGQRGDSSSS